MDGDRHNVVALAPVGEVDVVEALHGLRPGHEAQGERRDPQGQVGELRQGPRRRGDLRPPASEHLP